MRNKKARLLRRAARQLTVGLPAVKYGVQVHTKIGKHAKTGESITYQVGTLRLDKCTRLAYQNMKKLYKQQRRDSANRRIRTVSLNNAPAAQAA